MKKIFESTHSIGNFIYYQGFDPDMILAHEKNHNGQIMVVFATAREYLDKMPNSKRITESNYICFWEMPEGVDYEQMAKNFDAEINKKKDVYPRIIGHTIDRGLTYPYNTEIIWKTE